MKYIPVLFVFVFFMSATVYSATSDEVRSLMKDLSSPQWNTRENAAFELRKQTDPEIHKLIYKALKSGNSYRRKGALQAIECSNTSQQSAVGPLIGVLDDSIPLLRRMAADKLACFTNLEFGQDYDKWKNWWKMQQEGTNSGELIGFCLKNEIELIAYYGSDGSLIPLTMHGDWREPKPYLNDILSIIKNSSWFELKTDGTKSPLGKNPFPITKNSVPDEKAEPGDVLKGSRITLGSCNDPGSIFTTSPISKLRYKTDTRAGGDEYAAALLREKLTKAQPGDPDPKIIKKAVREIADDSGFIEAVVDFNYRSKYHDYGNFKFWGLFQTGNDKPVYSVGCIYPGPYIVNVSQPFLGNWDKWQKQKLALVSFDESSDGGGSGDRVLVLAIDAKGGRKAFRSILNYMLIE